MPVRLESTTEQELRFLEFFYQRTAPHISGFFDNDFYNKFLLQAGQYEPSIRYAMMACGAMHEHYEFEVVPAINRKNAAVADAPPKPPFALASYNKAISALMKQLSSSAGSVESVAMCCLLFVCLECLRGDPQSAAAHLRSGGSILASWLSRNKTIKGCVTEPPYPTPSTTDPGWVHTNLIPIFQRLGSHVSTAGQISSAEFNSLKDNLDRTDAHLDRFDSIMEARNSLLSLCALASRYVVSLAQNKYDRTMTGEEIDALMAVRQKMRNWDKAYGDFLDEADVAIRNSRRALVLWIQRRCYNVALGTALLPDQCAYDSYMEDYTFIVRNGERLYSRTNVSPVLRDAELSTFSLEEGITPACYFVASTCRDPILRRVAIRLLRQGPARQGIWNALLFASVAERIVEFEESLEGILTPTSSASSHGQEEGTSNSELAPLPIPRASSSESTTTPVPNTDQKQAFLNRAPSRQTAASIPEAARIHLADIKESPDGDPHRHSVTFMTRPDGLHGDWQTWTEQIVL